MNEMSNEEELSQNEDYWEKTFSALEVASAMVDPTLSVDERTARVISLVGSVDQRRAIEKPMFDLTTFLLASAGNVYKVSKLEIVERLQFRLLAWETSSASLGVDEERLSMDDLLPVVPAGEEESYIKWLITTTERLKFTEAGIEGTVSQQEHDRLVNCLLSGLGLATYLFDSSIPITFEAMRNRGLLYGGGGSLRTLMSQLPFLVLDYIHENFPILNRYEVLQGFTSGVVRLASGSMSDPK